MHDAKPTMSPRQRVEKALLGGHADRVPFTIYESMIPQCVAERRMRNRGLCIVKRIGVFRSVRPNVKVTEHTTSEDAKRLTRTLYETPVGSVSMLTEPAGFTTWVHERLLKRPEDYEVIRFMLEDEQFEPAYDDFLAQQSAFGEDAIFRAAFGLEPLQTLISGSIMGTVTFCTEWMDRRDEVLKLYEIIVRKRREVYPIVAASPALHANYGGNVTPEIIGPAVFRQYYLPHYQEAAELMHRHGKLIGCHFDANCRVLAPTIAESDLDYIEAFTPSPDTDMTLAEARQVWPGKALWINFPSSVHLAPDEAIRRRTVELIEEADTPDGLLIGITENIPEQRWQASCRAIMDGIDDHAGAHPDAYQTETP